MIGNNSHSGAGAPSGPGGLEAFAAAVGSDAIRALQRQAGLPDQYLADLRAHVVPLAIALQRQVRAAARPLLVGLNGCQGSGKSTMAQFLAAMLRIGAGTSCAIVSIDDFYLEASVRRRLAREVHPLLMTRGVPGTHDLVLANSTLNALLDPSREAPVQVPVFDKAGDNRAPRAKWPFVAPGVDLVLLEGWCVACPPQKTGSLREPVNELERDEDTGGAWRRYVNDALKGGYRALFDRLDLLVMLAAPGFDRVFDWRRQQELQLAQTLRERGAPPAIRSRLLTGQALLHFIQHYERLTRHQLDVLPGIADGVIELGYDHRMIAHFGRLFA